MIYLHAFLVLEQLVRFVVQGSLGQTGLKSMEFFFLFIFFLLNLYASFIRQFLFLFISEVVATKYEVMIMVVR